MEDQFYIDQFSNLLPNSGVSYAMQRVWDNFQREYSINGLVVIETRTKSKLKNYWQCYLRQTEKSNFLGLGSKKENIYDFFNRGLREYFTNRDLKANASFWNKVEKRAKKMYQNEQFKTFAAQDISHHD